VARIAVKSEAKAVKHRRTKQRQLVLAVVRVSGDHPTAAQVYQRVRRRDPRVAYATIYNALRWWVARGELREFTFGNAAARYDRNRDRHDHAICTKCGRLEDLVVSLPKRVLKQAQRQTSFSITSHHVQLLGICSCCAGTG